eukprot:38640-Eustigmatos_ZCMA.PRE.1
MSVQQQLSKSFPRTWVVSKRVGALPGYTSPILLGYESTAGNIVPVWTNQDCTEKGCSILHRQALQSLTYSKVLLCECLLAVMR